MAGTQQNTGEPGKFPTRFMTLVQLSPSAVGGPKKLWQKLEQQVEQAGGHIRESYEMPFTSDYNLVLIGEATQAQAILRIDAACRYEPGVIKSQTTPVVPAAEHFEQVEQLVGAGAR